MNVNSKFKASVFSLLFNDPDTLRELYCALEGVTLPPNIPVTINTLEDVLFMDRINDISFEIGGKLVVLIEHQSTINPNMALRLLIYIARVYEKIVDNKKLYSTKQIALPRPEFFVLYNGNAPCKDTFYMNLSDMFENVTSIGLKEKENPALELSVKVININEGKNKEIVNRCRILSQYSVFVETVRKFEKEGNSKQEAVKKAVIYCRNHDILKEFLENNASEVLNMLITEWNWDDALAVRYQEGREEGREQEREEIARNALAEGASIEFIQKITGLDLGAIEKVTK